jgi:hypothetical protein
MIGGKGEGLTPSLRHYLQCKLTIQCNEIDTRMEGPTLSTVEFALLAYLESVFAEQTIVDFDYRSGSDESRRYASETLRAERGAMSEK